MELNGQEALVLGSFVAGLITTFVFGLIRDALGL